MADEEEIPKDPSAPPTLGSELPIDFYPCKRRFVYQGKTLICDSNIERDAERLKTIMTDVPEALSEIEKYQQTRQKVKKLAYVATAGIALFLTGRIVTNLLMPKSQGFSAVEGTEGFNVATNTIVGDPRSDQETTRLAIEKFTFLGGLGIAGASVIGAAVLLGDNESHIGAAVNFFNRAHPDRPIELQFSTGFNF